MKRARTSSLFGPCAKIVTERGLTGLDLALRGPYHRILGANIISFGFLQLVHIQVVVYLKIPCFILDEYVGQVVAPYLITNANLRIMPHCGVTTRTATKRISFLAFILYRVGKCEMVEYIYKMCEPYFSASLWHVLSRSIRLRRSTSRRMRQKTPPYSSNLV